MRVLTIGNMYPPHHLGGYELLWRSAVAHLRERGHEVRVLTTDYLAQGPDPSASDVHRQLRWYWHDHEFPRLSTGEVLALERHNARVFARHAEDFQPDATSWWAMGGMSLSLIERGRRAGLPSSGVAVDDWLIYGPQVDAWLRRARRLPLLGALARAPARVDLDRVDDWLFASDTLLDGARSAGWSLPTASVAYPGIDQDLFEPTPPREEWGLSLLYCGRLDERKGIDVAIEALSFLPEATLRVVGGGDKDHLRALEALSERRGLTSRVRFEQLPRDELPKAYAAADATLFPVRWAEPFGLVPLESMASGTPVVASGRGGSGEYLRDGENCVLFEVDDGPRALAAAVQRLADPALRERLYAGGLETASRFREDDFNAEVEESLVRAIRRRLPEES